MINQIVFIVLTTAVFIFIAALGLNALFNIGFLYHMAFGYTSFDVYTLVIFSVILSMLTVLLLKDMPPPSDDS